ncbi:F-actin capping protein beta subunit [Schizosaccharomyces japonicus yFS275]|uniref:F-actin-capping protein subunit beta n=1 Tax=Schizosaccharomyces japonicus (strain yFS275 / FY16936) TaxID=402676 RepID=B6K0Y2_SCHJY|nr:F-actin capping protein beta subunit [Schizosaccharomyces japonicus yFS275]EEB07603.1 F-actin capping protein beta subunit [Schizosaccharomyces japonicus yFS275]
MANTSPEDAALDLFRRLNPDKISKNLDTVLQYRPDLSEVLLSSIDQPLRSERCADSGNQYLLCDFNRDGDSYRSPWSNKYAPALDDGIVPSDHVRDIEVRLNNAMRVYVDMYYEGGVSSVYLWDQDEYYAGAVLIKKGSSDDASGWDSIHVFECLETGEPDKWDYQLTSTIILHMQSSSSSADESKLGLSGQLTRQTSQRLEVSDVYSQVANVGRMVEDMENRMRTFLQEVYFGKTNDVVNAIRSVMPLEEVKENEKRMSNVVSGMSKA